MTKLHWTLGGDARYPRHILCKRGLRYRMPKPPPEVRAALTSRGALVTSWAATGTPCTTAFATIRRPLT